MPAAAAASKRGEYLELSPDTFSGHQRGDY
jgi:hypothetical protein